MSDLKNSQKKVKGSLMRKLKSCHREAVKLIDLHSVEMSNSFIWPIVRTLSGESEIDLKFDLKMKLKTTFKARFKTETYKPQLAVSRFCRSSVNKGYFWVFFLFF